jgi:hypothetical protein
MEKTAIFINESGLYPLRNFIIQERSKKIYIRGISHNKKAWQIQGVPPELARQPLTANFNI